MRLLSPIICLALISCGGGGGDSATVSGTLSGTVSGLTTSGLVLSNGNDTVSVASGASAFSFTSTTSGSYSVTVSTQPDGQTCAVSNGSGTVTGNISTIAVTCRDYKLYVANNSGKSIGFFGINSGSLNAVSTIDTPYSPVGIQLSPDGIYLYLTYSSSKIISTYSIAQTGAVTSLASANGQTPGNALEGFGTAPAVSPNGKYLYSPNYSANKISQFSVSNIGLTALSPETTVAVENVYTPVSMVVTPNGKYAYVVNQSSNHIQQFSVNSNGTLSALPTAAVSTTSNTEPIGITVDPSSSHVYVTLRGSNQIAQFSISSDGSLSSMSPAYVASGTKPQGIAITPDGKYLYVTNAKDGTVSQYSISGGKLTAMSPATVTAGTTPGAIAISPDSKYVYVANYGDSSISQYSIASGGYLSSLSTSTVSSNISGPTSLTVR